MSYGGNSLLTPVVFTQETVLRGMTKQELSQNVLPLALIETMKPVSSNCFALSTETLMFADIVASLRENNPYLPVALMCELILNTLYYHSHWRTPIDFADAFCIRNHFKRCGKAENAINKIVGMIKYKVSSKMMIGDMAKWGIFSVRGQQLIDDVYEYTIEYLGDYRVKEWEYQNQTRIERSGHLKDQREG